MTQRSHNPFPVDPTGPLTVGSIPAADLDRLIDATIAPIERLRSALADVTPESVTASDALALIDLLQAATKSESELGRAMHAREAARQARLAQALQ